MSLWDKAKETYKGLTEGSEEEASSDDAFNFKDYEGRFLSEAKQWRVFKQGVPVGDFDTKKEAQEFAFDQYENVNLDSTRRKVKKRNDALEDAASIND